MISAVRGTWFARFDVGDAGDVGGDDGWGELESGAEQGSMYFEVVAWDGEGHALIVNVQAGCLRRANEVPGFTGLATAMEATAAPVAADDE